MSRIKMIWAILRGWPVCYRVRFVSGDAGMIAIEAGPHLHLIQPKMIGVGLQIVSPEGKVKGLYR